MSNQRVYDILKSELINTEIDHCIKKTNNLKREITGLKELNKAKVRYIKWGWLVCACIIPADAAPMEQNSFQMETPTYSDNSFSDPSNTN